MRFAAAAASAKLLPLLLLLQALLPPLARAEPVLIRGGWNGRDDVEVERNATELSFGERMIAGSIARAVAQTTLHPIDVIRTRLQAHSVKTCFKPQTLVRGVTPQFALSLPAGAIQFGSLEFAKRQLREHLGDLVGAAGVDLMAGAVGAASASVVRVPQEVLKQGIQASLYDNIGHAVGTMWGGPLWRPAGGVIQRFYRGYLATLTRDIPWNALSYTFFMAFRSFFLRLNGKTRGDAVDPKLDLAFGAAGGALGALLTHPIDVVKTRIMTAKAGHPLPGDGYVMHAIRELVEKEGIGVLGVGLLPRVLYLAPLASIIFSIFEAIKVRLVRLKVKQAVLSAAVEAATTEVVEGDAAAAAAAVAVAVEEATTEVAENAEAEEKSGIAISHGATEELHAGDDSSSPAAASPEEAETEMEAVAA